MANDLQVFQQTMSFSKPERVLFYFDCTPDLARRVREHVGSDDVAEHYGLWQRSSVWPERPEGLPTIDYTVYYKDVTLPPNASIDGAGVAHLPGDFYHFDKMLSPLRNATSIQQIQEYPLESVANYDWSNVRQKVDELHAAGRTVGAWLGHMYESAWQIRGYEEFLMDMLTQPEWAHLMLQRVIDAKADAAVRYAQAGVDIIYCGDDVANQRALMFQPELWREFMLSRWSKVWASIHKANPNTKVWYHSDGDIGVIVDELVAAGVDILNPIQPECLDVDAIYARHAGKLAFDGGMGTQSTMPWGSPADVKARVKELIQKYGQKGGLMLSPTHVLEPEVPLANIDAFCEACREYGR